MYESYFSFQRAPFSIAPDPSFLYPGPQHKKGLEQLNYGLRKEGGFIVLTGEVGTGKTTLSRLFLSQLGSNTQLASVYNAKLNSSDLLSNIAAELKLELDNNASEFEKTQAISEVLLNNHQHQRKTLLMIEEAQNLSPDTLETLRLLTNIETDTAKLLHILLIGQPELVTTLNRPDLRQLNQRVIARYHLRPLNAEETENYIIHRLSVAGGQQNVFKRAAVQALFDYSGGIPRLINLLADRALQIACENDRKSVNAKDIDTANELINGAVPLATVTKSASKPQWLLPSFVAATALLLFALIFVLLNRPSSDKPITAEIAESTSNQPKIAAPVAAATPKPLASTQDTIATVPAPTSAPTELRITPEAHLLQRWNITATADDELCTIANRHELECFNSRRLSLQDLIALNRPAILTVFNQAGLAEPAVLTRVADDTITLYSQSQSLDLSLNELANRWRGDVKLLWKPAPGWIDSVRQGDRSVQVMQWLQQALSDLNEVEGKIITGGYYTELLADKVANIQRQAGLEDDGILGRKTVMAINSRLATVPLLTSPTERDDSI